MSEQNLLMTQTTSRCSRFMSTYAHMYLLDLVFHEIKLLTRHEKEELL